MRIFVAIFLLASVGAIASQFLVGSAQSKSPAEIYSQLLEESRKDPQQTLKALEAGVFQCIPGVSKSEEGATEASFMIPKMLIKMIETAQQGASRDAGRAELKTWLKTDLGGFISALPDKKAKFIVSIIEVVSKDPTIRTCIAEAAL